MIHPSLIPRLLSLLRRLAPLAVASASVLLAGCAAHNPDFDPAKPHHRPEGFQNNYTTATDKSRADFLRWQFERTRDGLPPAPASPTPVVAPDLAFIQRNATAGAAMQPAATWIGHATMLVQMGGLNILTDPMFSERASPVSFAGPRRAQPPGLSLAQLPRIDLVLISHNHYDHLDRASVRALAAQPGGSPLFVVPLGLKRWLADEGVERVVQLDWWDSTRLGEVEVHLTPVQHWSARGPFDRRATLWGGFAVFAPDFHLYFSGDTGYSRDFTDTRARFAARQTEALGGSFDLALIAMGAYEPRWFMKEQHVNPAEAVQIHKDVGAKRSIGVHWGTFSLTDEPLDQPPLDLALARRDAGLPDDAFVVLAIGQTQRLPRRIPRP